MNTTRLKQLASELKQASDLSESLQQARQRQHHMLPKTPKIDGIQFASIYSPSANVSGDFYDYIRISENEIGISLGDVSGHGIEAAIVMGMAKKAIQIYAKSGGGAKHTMAQANEDLGQDLDPKTFISAAYGVLDVKTRVFKFVRAGNQPPFLVNPFRPNPLTEIRSPGMALGADRTGKFFMTATQELSIELRPGDVFFQYTDGLNEATDLSNGQFGIERIKMALLSNHDKPLGEMLQQVEHLVQKHIAPKPQDDDITMVAFKIE